MDFIKAENNNKIVVVGGIITAVRTILTKKGDKMAFVKIENKSTETEIIVFPNTFAEVGGKLVVDNVVKVTGKVNATDKNGNPTSDVKLLAEAVEVVSDDVLEGYQSTGTKLAAPVSAPDNGRRKYSRSSAERVSGSPSSGAPAGPVHVLTAPPKDPRKERLYILIKNIEDTEVLAGIRRLADIYIGVQDVVLVIKDGDAKRPLKMPFHVEVSEELIAKLKALVGNDNVKVQ